MTLWGQGTMKSQAFNNLFSAAAALIHHRTDIILFFQDAKMPSNLKQKSVHADAKCDLLAVMLLGLALAYIYVSGPFWTMILGSVLIYPATVLLLERDGLNIQICLVTLIAFLLKLKASG